MKLISKNNKKSLWLKRGQTMMEYLVLVSVIGVGSIVVLTKFGNVFRGKVSSAATAMTSSTNSNQSRGRTEADEAASATESAIQRDMENFADGEQ